MAGPQEWNCTENCGGALKARKPTAKDAVVGIFTDSDFRGGGTDGKGSMVGFDYQLAKNVQAGVTYFNNTLGVEGSKKYERLQLDVSFKF